MQLVKILKIPLFKQEIALSRMLQFILGAIILSKLEIYVLKSHFRHDDHQIPVNQVWASTLCDGTNILGFTTVPSLIIKLDNLPVVM